VLARPQLIGNSRHITGAYSILDQEWDDSKNTLSGTSDAIPGEPYSLWFYLPKGFNFEHLSAVAKGSDEIQEQHQLTDSTLMVSFKGQQQPVRWKLSFGVSPRK